ncbi:MAG: hypothetical protein H6740_04480 [Alphaproteobacteria bacterium]|nr:hypothetical protein [Alphaproteobacteria bacterium]
MTPLLLTQLSCAAPPEAALPSPAPEAALPAPVEPSPPKPDCHDFAEWLATEGLSAKVTWRERRRGQEKPQYGLLAISELEDGRVVYAECDVLEGEQWLAELGPEGLRWHTPIGVRACCGEHWLQSVSLAPVEGLPGAWAVTGTLSHGGEYFQYDGRATWVGWPGREVSARCEHEHGVPTTWRGGLWVPEEGVLAQYDRTNMVAASWQVSRGRIVSRERWLAAWDRAPGSAPRARLATATRTLRATPDGGLEEICDAPEGHVWEVVF